MEIWQVTTTLPSDADAQRIAKRLVTERLAACVQIDGPIRSIYSWQDALANETEWRCTIKTVQSRVDACFQLLRENHPYTVPEILASPIAQVDPDYAAWVAGQVKQ